MTSPEYYIPSTSDYDSYSINSPDASPQHSYLNNKVMVVATVTLFCLLFFITSLHIYCKLAWRNFNRTHQNQTNSDAHSSALSKDAIAQLPTFTYRAPASSDLEAGQNAGLLECAVCLSEFQDDERGRLLPSCKHSFHIECIDMWFYSHSSCPLCRAVVMPTIAPSPSILISISTPEQQQGAEELALHEATSSTHESSPLNTMVIPAGGDAANAMVHQSQSSSSSSSSSRPTRSVPHITIEIPTRLVDISLTSPGFISNFSNRRSRCASPHEAACSSLKSLKSPGLRKDNAKHAIKQREEGIHKL